MYAIITIFYVSIIGMFVMLLLKSRELRSGKRNIVSRLGQGTDHVFGFFLGKAHKGFSYFNKKTFVLLANWIAFHVLLRIRNIYVDLKHKFISNPHGKKLIDAVRGRGEVRHHGASFYLRRISDK